VSKSRKLAYFALFLTSFFWGLAPPVIKYSLNFISPIPFLFFRFSLACLIFLFPLIYKIIKIKPTVYDWGQYLLLGFLSTPLNLLLYFLGVSQTSAIDSSVVAILSPILIVLGGVIFLKEKLTKRESLGIVIAILGTFYLSVLPVINNVTGSQKNLVGNLLIIAGDIIWAFFALRSKIKKNSHLDPFILSSFSFFVGWLTLLPIFILGHSVDGFTNSLNPKAIPGIIYMAFFSSVIAYSAYTYGLKKIEASEASIWTYLQPLFAVPVAVFFLKEKITPAIIIGAVLITIGVFICESRPKPNH
jgi:drug/metabolite transporter (DMT)-like permease